MLPATTAEAARRFADRIAYVSEHGWSLTYADIDRISDEVAVGLARTGVDEGSVVALVLPPGPEYLLAYVAAAKLGAITAGVNDRLSARERDGVLERAAPRLVIAAPGLGSGHHDSVEIGEAESALGNQSKKDALGRAVVARVAVALADVSKIETDARLEGKALTMILTPK